MKDNVGKTYARIEPYKLMNHKGIWYLVAKDDDKLKTFTFSRIERVHLLETHFVDDPHIDKTLIEEDGIWFNEHKKKIVLNIAKEVAVYFKRRDLIANQVIEREHEDGSLIVSALFGHTNQILPIIRYWIPHIRIISPESLQQTLDRELADYLKLGNIGLK